MTGPSHPGPTGLRFRRSAVSRSVRVLFLFALPVGAIGSCSVYRAPEVVEVPKPSSQDSVFISSPVRAHLLNG